MFKKTFRSFIEKRYRKHSEFKRRRHAALERKFDQAVVIVLATVLVRRVKVANQYYRMIDSELLLKSGSQVSHINTASSTFTTPLPALSAVSSANADFQTSIENAANRDTEMVAIKNTKRFALINLLVALSNYVEDVANDPANVLTGAVVIIQSADMRPRVFAGHAPQIWDVRRGTSSRSLSLTAASVTRAVHFWAYTTTPAVDNSWIEVTPTNGARTTITGLTVATFVYCRHRVFVNGAYTEWEGHDPVVVV